MARPRKRSRVYSGEARFGTIGKAMAMFLFVAMSWGAFIFTRIASPEASVDAAAPASGGVSLAAVAPAGDKDKRVAQASKGKVNWNQVPEDDRFYLVFSTVSSSIYECM